MTRILVAEDSAVQATHFRSLLTKAGYETMVVGDGQAALDVIGEFEPDIVVTDLEMPRMNGLDLVNAMRLQNVGVPVILITAHGSEELAVEALQRGAAAYVPKTQVNDVLPETIEQVAGLLRADRTYARLQDCMTLNEFKFELANDPELVDPLVDLVQQMVAALGLVDPVERIRVGVAVENAIGNAIYRGNLEMRFEDTEDDRERMLRGEQTLVEQRKSSAPYCDRRVHFHARIDRESARFVVRDDGSGFDTSTVPQAGDPDALERQGGRGLLLIQSFMDEVSYNEAGNEITMVKRRSVA